MNCSLQNTVIFPALRVCHIYLAFVRSLNFVWEFIFQAHVFNFQRYIWDIYLLLHVYISIELHHWVSSSIDTSMTVNVKLCWRCFVLYFGFLFISCTIAERRWGWANGVRTIQSNLIGIAKNSYWIDPLSKQNMHRHPLPLFSRDKISESSHESFLLINYAWT